MGVLPPFPRIDHKVAETGARRRQGLGFPGFDRSGLDDGHQNSFRRVVAENHLRMLVVSHRMDVKIAVLLAKESRESAKVLTLITFVFKNQ